MTSLWLALQFLTIIPVKVRQVDDKKIAYSTMFFPVVGLLLGLILCGSIFIFTFMHLGELAASILVVLLLVFLCGGLHLDGLADTADAFLSRKGKEEMLGIMRDSHIGAMGVLSLISILLLKVALIFSLNPSIRLASILLMCMLSRWSMVLAMYLFPYARKEGKAKIFMQGKDLKVFIFSTASVMALAAVIWQFKGLALLGAVAIATFSLGWSIRKKIDGITGDTIGAINEINEVFILFVILIIERIWA